MREAQIILPQSMTERDPPAFSLTDLGFPISLRQGYNGRFTVTYGLQISTGLGYARACRELGENIMHALACEGKITNA